MLTPYGVATDYEKTTDKREYVTVWSGPFLGNLEATGYANNGARTYSLTTLNGDRVPVALPTGVTAPRTELNYDEIDEAIGIALVRHFEI